MAMKFNILHLVVCNKIIDDLDDTLIVTVKNSQGFDRKPKLTQGLLNPYGLSTSINYTMILSFRG